MKPQCWKINKKLIYFQAQNIWIIKNIVMQSKLKRNVVLAYKNVTLNYSDKINISANIDRYSTFSTSIEILTIFPIGAKAAVKISSVIW